MSKDPTLVWALWVSLVAMAGLVGAFVRAILTGRLVPRTTVEDIRADRDKWETAWRLSQAALQETVQQGLGDIGGRMDANTDGLRLVERLVEALATKGPVR
jgi:hypothetical protein